MNPYSLDDPLAAAKFLMSRGWRPVGSPHFQWTKWLDPEAPEKDSYTKVIKTAPHIDRWDDSTKQYLTIEKPVMVKDRHGRPVDCEQLVFTPARQPIAIDRALEVQIARAQTELTKAAVATAVA